MKIQLSIAMLVSDREEILKRCLDSLRQLLRELPCELIVVFTGKEEKVLKIVRQYTDHVIPFAWCNDFSAARNVGLRAARGEWFMYLDDDEWFEDTGSICEFFKSGEYKGYRAASYIVRNYRNWGGMDYTDAHVARMVRRSPEIRFEGSIHEYFVPVLQAEHLRSLPDYVHHYGYISKKRRKSGGRAKRNAPLLLEEIEKNPSNGKNYMQLAQEYRNEGDYGKAEQYARRSLEVYAQDREHAYPPEYWSMAHLPLLIALQGDKERALQEAERLLHNKRSYIVVDMYLYMAVAQISCELGLDQRCIEAVREFHKLKECLNDRREFWDTLSVEEISAAEITARAYKVYVSGLNSRIRSEDWGGLIDILGMIPWDREFEMSEEYYTMVEKWREEQEEKQVEILRCFSTVESENPYIDFLKAMDAEAQGDIGRAEDYYLRYCEKGGKECVERFAVELGVRHGFDITIILKRLSLEKWNLYAEAIVKDMELDHHEAIMEQYRTVFERHPLYFSCLKYQVCERLMLEKVYLGERLISMLDSFCEAVLHYYTSLYREEYFEGDMLFCLPSICQFGVAIRETLDMIEKENWQDAIKGLRTALDIHPGLSVLIKRLLDHVVMQSKETPQKAGGEFEVLGRQIKEVLGGMIERREYVQAEPIMEQLLTLLPDDLEVLKMKQVMLQNM